MIGGHSLAQPLAVGLPLAGAAAVWAWGRYPPARRGLALASAVATLGLAGWIYAESLAGQTETWRIAPPWGTPLGLALRFDGLGALFGLVIAFVWLAGTLNSWTYLSHGEDRNRYYVFLLAVLGLMMGVAGAADFVTLLVFFELMTLASYVLVVHNQSPEAVRGGEAYLYLGVFGGLCLLTGVVAMAYLLGTTEIAAGAAGLAGSSAGARWTIVGLLVTGFGIKAGMAPWYVWLPAAHPVAPSPASALLSGVMIKAGAYGIVRTVGLLPAPGGAAAAGLGLIWLGVATMLLGVVLALLQENAKRLLAYHSVSQMGYILLGLGIGAYLGPAGAAGFGGAILHLINHALFQACLFLAVGVVLLKTGEVNLYRLGGLWRYMPFTAFACFCAAAGIAGVPLFNGYASKTLLHHAALAAAGAGGRSLLWAERLFVLTGVGTAASFVKLYSLIFLGRAPARLRRRTREEWPLRASMGLLVAAILAIGLFPNLALRWLIAPAAAGFGFDRQGLAHVVEAQLFAARDLLSVATTLFFGALLFFVGLRLGLFHLHGPHWLSLEWLARAGARAGGRAWLSLVAAWTVALAGIERRLRLALRRLAQALPALDYLPGGTATAREFNLLNLDFDFYIVLTVIAAALMMLGLWHLGG